MNTYQHTQPAKTILVSLVFVLLIIAGVSIFFHPLIFSVVILLVVGWLFRSLTIEISETELIWYFGSGFPRKRAPLNEVMSAEVVRTTFAEGWGIHYTRRGWLYNVSGRDAVAVKLRNGTQFCLGTDEPEKLADELNRRRSWVRR